MQGILQDVEKELTEARKAADNAVWGRLPMNELSGRINRKWRFENARDGLKAAIENLSEEEPFKNGKKWNTSSRI